MTHIAHRRNELAVGNIDPEALLVPGSMKILSALKERGVEIYIASGTDEEYVLEEAHLLGVDVFAKGKIYGAQRDYKNYSKEMVIRRILKENSVDGNKLIAFGDGYVEIADCKAVNGIAVGVASDEAGRSGAIDPWKRYRLIGAGADLIIPDYRQWDRFIDYVWSPTG
jgi:soluble P-type ATPase